MGRFRTRTLLLLATLLAVGCSRDPASSVRWQSLAGEEVSWQRRPAATGLVLADREVRFVEQDGHDWLETTIAREEWTPVGSSGLWQCGVPLTGMGRPPAGVPRERLRSGEREFDGGVPKFSELAHLVPAGSFKLRQGLLTVKHEEGEQPAPETVLSLYVDLGERRDGVLRFRGRRFSGEGLVVRPGERAELELDLPARSALRFASCAESYATDEEASGNVRFRVLLDGELLFEGEQEVSNRGSLETHVLALPEAGRSQARLGFEVAGDVAHTLFLDPVIAPAERGDYASRPWGPARPHIVVFQADTFRADNMLFYGGEPGLTPFLDELVSRSLVSRHAYAVSTWTLPTHASLLSGLFPHQAGISGRGDALPEDVLTVAAHLAGHGYRTGAVTDAVMVSQRFGFESGFAWFDERRGSLEETFARVDDFLAADDGRPIFLFVQSYRVHLPYTVSEETRREMAGRLDLSDEFRLLYQRFESLDKADAAPEVQAEVERLAHELRDHYLGGVVDLDRGLRGFVADLEARGLLEAGALVFTSDHGEAFNDHGEMIHGGRVWEEQTRVPLLLCGAGITPGVVEHPTSSVDLAPTLAELARVPPAPRWVGQSLLSLERRRPIYLFQCQGGQRSTLGVIDEQRKLIGFEGAELVREAELFAAFDLGADPGELRNLLESEASWPRELYRRHEQVILQLLERPDESRASQLSADDLDELRAMGYGGD